MSKITTKMRCALVIFAVIGCFAYWLCYGRTQLFIYQWSNRFKSLGTLRAVKDYKESRGYVPVCIREFETGEWVVAAMEHSCCSGAGFNASVFFDSTGTTFVDTTYSFCGIEGMGDELHRLKAANLSAFYSGLTKLQLQKR